ncbi:hypothetical protein O181_079578 [Austropuccinia psidii MF-1]|uniref:Uncharacterized protein n=1 Tax=Austropuccinia psidii MF-1 TaxID=1389203 RepID=A0A9Q3FL94_9BASI|nr:hypothetical protein [Austropuccinia psidii MF-1]
MFWWYLGYTIGLWYFGCHACALVLSHRLTGTPSVPQRRAPHGSRSTIHPSRKGAKKIKLFLGVVGRFPGLSKTNLKGLDEDGEEEEENYVEEDRSDGTEVFPALVGASQGTGGPTLPQSNQPFSQSEPSLFAIMQQMTQIMTNIQAASYSESSRPPSFKAPSMKAPECFDGTQPFKGRSFIQSFQLKFHNDPANFYQDRKKVPYAT